MAGEEASKRSSLSASSSLGNIGPGFENDPAVFRSASGVLGGCWLFVVGLGLFLIFYFVWFLFAFPFTVLKVQFATLSHCYNYVFSTLNCFFSSSSLAA